MPHIVIASFYKFITLSDVTELRPRLLVLCRKLSLTGTILLAEEGINATIAGSRDAIDKLLAHLRTDTRFADLKHKESFTDQQPFVRMKVRHKQEIVTIGKPEISPCKRVGTYVEPKRWNDLISDPEVLLVDTRNSYEVSIGQFVGAINPNTDSFREFPDYVRKNLDPAKHKKVAMYCTGGIRCEKSTAYMLEQGFAEVYHLKGGILKYLEEVPAQESLWQGECFVFDERVTVDHDLNLGSYHMCHGCRMPISEEDMASPYYERSVSCPHCYHDLSDDQRERFKQRKKQMDLAKQRNEKHIGRMFDKTG